MSPTKPPPSNSPSGRHSAPPPRGTPPSMMPPRRTWLWFLLILILNFFVVRLLSPGPEGPVTVPYTLFKEEVRKGNVQSIYSQGDSMSIPASEKRSARPLRTVKGRTRACL